MGTQDDKNFLTRIERLKRRAAGVAEDDAKEHVADPVLTLVKSMLDLLADMERART